MIVWHYTTGEMFLLITEAGELQPTRAYVPPEEKPILWFSAHPYFEPTARKMWQQHGKLRILEVPELHAKTGGLVRFGLDADQLMSWEVLKKTSGMNRASRKALEAQGARQKAKPADWFGCFDPVPVAACVVEVMDADLRWVRVQTPALPAESPL